MTEHAPEKVAELIAEARTFITPEFDCAENDLIRRLADALEAEHDRAEAYLSDPDFDKEFVRMKAERDEALDVIRSIRLYCENQGDKFRYHAGEILSRIPEHPKEG